MFGIGAATIVAACFCGQVGGADIVKLPIVEQRVELISVAHLEEEDSAVVFFWSLVQGEWTCLDYRCLSTQMSLSRDAASSEWLLQWPDESDDCYRIVRSPQWVESWETVSPLVEQNNRVWFRQLLNPGLNQPQKMAVNAAATN